MAPSHSSHGGGAGSKLAQLKSPPLSKFFQFTKSSSNHASNATVAAAAAAPPAPPAANTTSNGSLQQSQTANDSPNPAMAGPMAAAQFTNPKLAPSSPRDPHPGTAFESANGSQPRESPGMSQGPAAWALRQGKDKPGASPKSSQDSQRTPSPANPLPSELVRKPTQDSYKLQPIAYSPNPQEPEDLEEEREVDRENDERGSQSWDEGDEEAAQTPSQAQDPQQSTPQVPPRLPLFNFEEGKFDQIDFAYKNRSRSNSCGTGHGPSQSEILSDAPPLPTSRPTAGNSEVPPLDKTDTAAGARTEESRGRSITSSESRGRNSPGRKDEKGASFFWHSPHSSEGGSSSPKPRDASDSNAETDNGGDQKPDKPTQEPLVLKTVSPTTAQNSLTSATALGFGGPSDWEHFGDYEAEEVDDIALYTSNKPKTAELPGAASDTEGLVHQTSAEAKDVPGQSSGPDRDGLPTIEERQSEAFEDEAATKQNGQQDLEDQRSSAHSSSPKPPSIPEQGLQQGSTELLSSQQEGGDAGGSRGSSKQDLSERRESPVPSKPSPAAAQGPPAQSESANDIQRTDSAESADASNDLGRPKEGLVSDPPKHRRMHSQDRAFGRPDSKFNTHRTPSEASGFRGFSRQSAVTSTLSSPVDDDDGKENIIISLQVPDSRPPNMNSPAMPMDQRFRDNPPSGSPHAPDHKPMTLPEPPQSGRRSVFPQSIEMEDPYAGLDPWAKASLNRYVKMLREEAQAPTDEEKFNIFITFTHNETRVRSVLYDMDDESDMSEHPSRHASVKGGANSLRPRVSVRSKALPALPPKDEVPTMPKLPSQGVPPQPDQGPISPQAPGRGSPNKITERTSSSGLREQTFQSPTARGNEDGFVMIDSTDDKAPAGKPKNSKDKNASQSKGTPTLGAWKRALEIVSPRASDKNAKSSPIQPSSSQEQLKTEVAPPASNASPRVGTALESSDQGGEGKVEGRAYEGDKAANRQTMYRPFSTLLRSTSVRNPSGDISNGRSRQSRQPSGDEASSASPTNHRERPLEEQKAGQRPVNYRYTVLEPLLHVIPQEGVLEQEPPQLVRLRQATDAIPDDFSFIHKTVLAWDAEAKKARERYEHERHARQGQSEARIDALFHDQEIGYGDINELEAEFKRTEAARKAEEDREEVATFVASVFDVVWARINYEMDQLTPLYEECTNLVSAASAGRGMFEDPPSSAAEGAVPRVPIAPAMEILLTLYQKLMIRHQKAFEAVLERDRRLKKTEVAPWYALGSIEKVKRIEKRFEDAEKKAILEFCRQRDERANLLMDVLDQNTLRGVGANQDYMESIMQAVRKISLDVARGGSPRPRPDGPGANPADGPGGGGEAGPGGPLGAEDAVSTDEVLKAKTVTAALAASSEQIVQTFHVADMLLNAADYEVSVANAKLSNADAAAFRRLREAKAKEDGKLAMDLEHRMGLIRGDTARTQAEIEKLLALLAARQEQRQAAAAVAATAASGGPPAGEGGAGPGEPAKGDSEEPGPRAAAAAAEEAKRKKKP